ncbi:CinA family nicotinamide mononucleotide deamidase-related protein [Rubrivirga sp. S365]|uniref:CinA-like protein n=1 Tax=Rubrivirga litoralis TaxID=3075598 RepID=A0ABU3BMJ8_9BACT|nr:MULTISPECIES: CinA family nicotinamide mononucleotide deamidase-related protein [unclassified Rubrivirga]MDT0630455.1 CinA family nicotinamide mononucleotide deamidase-related protein [Rubrivirga sp. F394]MDT7857567.1 CinA family nicotinamide mononucleotide deamidase-related protein [Rubrivirga sp. S365]
MTGHLLTVGDEILLGQIVNTNAAWLGERLAGAGVDLRRAETVGDDVDVIAAAIERAYADGAAVVVVTGGLGPTHDDVTRAAVARVFGRDLTFHPDLFAAIEARYTERGRTMPPIGRVMAEVPDGFDVLDNPKGTAPGLWGTRERAGRRDVVAVLPGVPYEMEAITEGSVLPRLRALQDGFVLSRTLLTVGRGESDLAGMLDGWTAPPGLALAYLPSLGTVRLRVTARGPDREAAQALVDEGAGALRDRLGTLVFGEGTTTLEAVVNDLLAEHGRTVAFAESCTGGAVAARVASVPGASRVLRGGVVAYDNAVKADLLGVASDALDDFGSVSEPVALQMARGVRERLGADVGVATTGVAGPTGGTPEKPVGTVWVAYADADGERAVGLRLTRDRTVNIGLTTTAALDLLRRQTLRSVGEG